VKIKFLIFSFFLISCSTSKNLKAPESVAFELVAMGSVWSFRIPKDSFSESTWWPLKNRSQEILENYDSVFSSWRKDSEVVQLFPKLKTRKLPEIIKLKISPLLREGLVFAERADELTHGAFDVMAPQGLDFGGITKGHVLGELAQLFLSQEISDFQIDGGGGNQVFAGIFRPQNLQKLSHLVFRSASGALQRDKQHIFDRRNPQRQIVGQAVVYCWVDINKNYLKNSTQVDVDQTKLVGSLSDAFSTALLVDFKNWSLPNFCQEAKAVDLKFL
jgi:hypothetical protein